MLCRLIISAAVIHFMRAWANNLRLKRKLFIALYSSLKLSIVLEALMASRDEAAHLASNSDALLFPLEIDTVDLFLGQLLDNGVRRHCSISFVYSSSSLFRYANMLFRRLLDSLSSQSCSSNFIAVVLETRFPGVFGELKYAFSFQ